MATESLILKLESDTKRLRADLDKIDSQLKDVDGSTSKADKSFTSLSASSKTLATGATAVVAAVGAAATALSTAAVAAADYSREIKLASQLSKESAEEIQLIAHATATVGIGLEQLGDISKDTLEKVGDYLNTGGGGFQDFADAMRLTKAETLAVASEFQYLSGPQILQEMVRRMEEADVSAVQMSHALEGMASDTTKLIPLLESGGKRMSQLRDAALSVTVPLSEADLRKFEDLKISADNAAASLKSLGNTVLLNLSNWFIEAADKAAHFYGVLNAGTVAEKSSRLADIKEEVDDLREGIENAETWTGRLWNTLTFNTSQESFAMVRINELLDERKKLQTEIAELGGIALPDAKESEKLKPKKDEAIPVGASEVDQLKAVEDRFKSEQELLVAKYEEEQLLARNNKELLAELENEFISKMLEMDEAADIARAEASLERWQKMIEDENQEKFDAEIAEQQRLLDQKLINEEDYLKAVLKLGVKYGKVTEKDKKSIDKKLDASTWDTAKSAMDAAGAVFSNNKAVSSTLAFINTAEGVTAALAKYDFVGAATIAATGAAQIASINSSSPGSSQTSVAAPSVTSPSDTTDRRVSSSVEIDETVTSGDNVSNQSINLTVTADTTSKLADALADTLEDMIKSGERKGFS